MRLPVPLERVATECPLAAVHGPSPLLPGPGAFGAGPFAGVLFEIRCCSRCGLGVTSPLPTPENARALYEDRSSDDFQPDDPPAVASLKRYFAGRDAARFARYAAGATEVLDFSCGNGAFVRALSRALPGARVRGSDVHEEPPPGLPAERYVPFDALDRMPGAFDLVLARHVLEHTYDPVRSLEGLFRLAAPGGVLAIEVPSLETPLRRLFGPHWDGYYVPYHPLHFTQRSLRLALEAAGFRVVATGGAEMPKMGRSLRNVLGGRYGPGHFLAGVALHPLQLLVGSVTRRPVCLRIWGRRPGGASSPLQATA